MRHETRGAATGTGANLATDAGTDLWTGFSDVWRSGYESIYTIRLVRGGLRTDASLVRHWPYILRWLVLAYGPSILTLLTFLAHRPWWPTLDIFALLVELGGINAGAFAAAALAWRFGLNRAGAVDDMLWACPRRDWVVGAVGRAVGHCRQAPLPLAFGVFPWIGAGVQGEFATHDVLPLVLVLANISWTLMLVANDCYWLIVPPVIAIRMMRCPELKLRWNDPARTPGIRILSEGYVFPAFFLALAALAVTAPRLAHYPLFGGYLPYLYVSLLLLSLWVGLVPQVCIYSVIRRFKLTLLDELMPAAEVVVVGSRAQEAVNYLQDAAGLKEKLAVYDTIAAAPGLPFGTATIVQYMTAIIGSLIGFLLQ